MQVGNIYVNRPNTGARVAIEPFGGFKLSGTGPKAGSADYLKAFHLFTENTYQDEFKDMQEDGSDYLYDIAVSSHFDPIQRRKKLVPILNEIYTRYESFFSTFSEVNKEKCKSFFHWIQNNLANYQTESHPNHFIPGQLSFNKKSMFRQSGAALAFTACPSLRSFINTMSAICAGSGLVILCRNEEVYRFWWEVAQIFYRHGYPKSTLELYLASDKLIKQALADERFDFFIIDATEKKTEQLLRECFTQNEASFLRMVLTNFDGPAFFDWSGFIDQFVYVRAYAINTMRHGAPLEVSL